MQSRADKRDTEFLNELKLNYEINVMNDTTLDFDNIISLLNAPEDTQTNAPDYQFDNGYIEKFDLSASKREKIGKKFQYTHDLSDHIMKKQIDTDEKNERFKTNYYAGDYLPIENRKRTSIPNLHENLFSLIGEKTEKGKKYFTTAKNNQIKGLLINLKYNIDVFKDRDSKYVDKIIENTEKCKKEYYQLWKNLDVINRIQKEFSQVWDIILFVRKYGDVYLKGESWVQEKKYYIYAFDLNSPIQEENLIKYPNPILHTQEDYSSVTIFGNRR